MGNVLQLATGESKVYVQAGTSNPPYSEQLTPAMGLFQDDAEGPGTSDCRFKRMGLFFKREDGSAFLRQWTIPTRNRIVQCYRAMKLLEHASIIQEDTLWAAYFLSSRDPAADASVADKDTAKQTVERCAQAILDSGVKNPMALRQELLDSVKIDNVTMNKMVESIMISDILPDINELNQEIELGFIEKSPAIEQLSIKFLDEGVTANLAL